MKLEIEFSKKTSYKWSTSDAINDHCINGALTYLRDKLRYASFVTYETFVNLLGISPNRAYLTCGWLYDDFIEAVTRPIEDGVILEIECREDIRNN